MTRTRLARSLVCWVLVWAAWRWGGSLAGANVDLAGGEFGWLRGTLGFLASVFGGAAGDARGARQPFGALALEGVAWLSGRVANFLVSAGSMFARVWAALRAVWQRALVPALQWLWRNFRTLSEWLRQKLRPLFEFLARLRRELWKIYDQFVRPILDIISVVRFGLRTLGRLGVDWARKLDAKLGEWQSVITDNFLKVVSVITQIQDTLNRIITFDFLLQRFALLHSIARDAPAVVRLWWNTQLGAVAPAKHGRGVGPKYTRQPMASHDAPFVAYLRTRSGVLTPVIAEMHDAFLFEIGKKPGLTPPE